MPRLSNGFFLAGMLAFAALLPASVHADGDVRQALFSAYEKMIQSRCVTDTVSTDAKGNETRSKVEFDTINRFRVSTDQASFVVLPEGTWMRSGDGDWTQPPIDMSAMFKRLLPSSLEEARAGTSNVKDEGMQSVGGVSLHAISSDVNMKVMGIAVTSHNMVYLDDSGRIVRSVSDGQAMGQKTHSVQTIRYDDSIRITAPN